MLTIITSHLKEWETMQLINSYLPLHIEDDKLIISDRTFFKRDSFNTRIEELLNTSIIYWDGIITLQLFDMNRTGKKISYYSNGMIESEFNHIDGLIHGKYIKYYPTGIIKNKCKYFYDKKHGVEKEYYEDGRIRFTKNYIRGGSGKYYNTYLFS